MTRHRVIRNLLCLLVVGMIWWLSQNRLVVTNETGQPIRRLTITVGDKTIQYENLDPGASVSTRFHIDHSTSVDVLAQLRDGTEIEDSCGYFVWEDDWLGGVRAHLVIGPGGQLEFGK